MERELEDNIWNELVNYKNSNSTEFNLDAIDTDLINNPVFTFKGKGLNGSVNLELAQFIIDFQHNIFRSYALLKYNTTDTRKLTKEDKEKLKVAFEVKEGSSELIAQLKDIIIKEAPRMINKLNGKQITLITLVFLALYLGDEYFKDYLDNKAKERQMLVSKEMSIQETNRLEIIKEIAMRNPQIAVIQADADSTYDSALRTISKSESGIIHGEKIDAQYAKELMENDKVKSITVRLDGNYSIRKIDTSRDTDDRFQVRNVVTLEEFTASVQKELIPVEDFDRLVQSAMKRKIIALEINGLRLKGKIEEAYIVGVKPDTESSK